MNTSGHLPVSTATARRLSKKVGPNGKKHAKNGNGKHPNGKNGNGEVRTAPVGSLTRTKALLLAALRVWELKHRISE